MGYNTRSSRVLLSSIPTLTFYADEDTSFRRTEPVQQLTCQGKACQVYQPPVVQCQNMGGSGAELVWAVRRFRLIIIKQISGAMLTWQIIDV